jgi:glutamine synthetase adenylyltransferase
LSDVRVRLERSEAAANFKTAPGGVYDIDYLVGSLQARRQVWVAGNLHDRLQLLRENSVLPADECQQLSESVSLLRTLEHVVRLVTGRARKWMPVAEHPRRAVQKLLWRVLKADDSFDPEMRLAEVLRQTREIYAKHRAV